MKTLTEVCRDAVVGNYLVAPSGLPDDWYNKLQEAVSKNQDQVEDWGYPPQSFLEFPEEALQTIDIHVQHLVDALSVNGVELRQLGTEADEDDRTLAVCRERYAAIAVSTGHVSKTDSRHLTALAKDPDECRVMHRRYGWFIKLCDQDFDSDEEELKLAGLSPGFHRMLRSCHRAGYRLVEFDSGADEAIGKHWRVH